MAVVGDKIILNSSVLEESFFRAQQEKINPSSEPSLFRDLFTSILKERIQRAVVVSVAEKDTSISVSYNEIDENLNLRIEYFINQVGSVAALEKEMGLSLDEIKSKYWDEIKEELLISSFQRSLFGGVSVSRGEVFVFFNNKKNSIPLNPSKASFSLLEKKTTLSKKTLSSLLFSINSLRDSLLGGFLNFGEVARKRSLDPSSINNLGKITSKRGDLVPEYEKASFSLDVGEISSPVLTKHGYHLIKLLDVVGEKTTTQHILFEKKASKDDFSRSVLFLDSLRVFSLNDPGLFDSLAFAHKSNSGLSGFYENVSLSLFPKEVGVLFLNTENHSFSDVVSFNSSSFLLYRYSFKKESESTLEEDWAFIEQLALEQKRFALFNLWIEEQYNKVYVKINPIY